MSQCCWNGDGKTSCAGNFVKKADFPGTSSTLPPHTFNNDLAQQNCNWQQSNSNTMNTNHLRRFNPARPASTAKHLLATALVALATVGSIPAQEITGQIYGVPSTVNNGDYTYNVTFQNSASSLNPVAFIWFAWTPDSGYYNYGGDLMPGTTPLDVQTPAGWSGNPYIYYPGYDGYSIQFTSSSTGLAPGQSVTFQFDSPDSPSTMSGTSPYPFYGATTYPILYSYYYQTTSETGAQGNFTVALVPAPEPSTLGLLALGSLVFLWSSHRYLHLRRPAEARSR
jgi:hypothetical protein